MACQKCRLPLTQPPHSQRLRCECSNLIHLGNSDRSLQVQERGRISSRVRRFQDKFRRNRSRTKSLSPSPSVSPRLSLIFTKPPPSGKRAFLCGVTYKKEKFRLRGTLHDVNSMRDLLVQKFNFSDESILILAGILVNLLIMSKKQFCILLLILNGNNMQKKRPIILQPGETF